MSGRAGCLPSSPRAWWRECGSAINLSKDIADDAAGDDRQRAPPPDPIRRLRIAYKVSSTRSRMPNFLKMLLR